MPIESYEKKLAFTIHRDDYDRVIDRLHHGQLTLLMRTFFKSIGAIMEESGKAEIYAWLEGEENLSLPPAEREK